MQQERLSATQPQQFPNQQVQQPQQSKTQYNQYHQAEPTANTNNLLGVAFSPSNEVSQVKYTSAGLNYNF